MDKKEFESVGWPTSHESIKPLHMIHDGETSQWLSDHGYKLFNWDDVTELLRKLKEG